MKFKIETGTNISAISQNTSIKLRDRLPLREAEGIFGCPAGILLSEGKFKSSTTCKWKSYTSNQFSMSLPFGRDMEN